MRPPDRHRAFCHRTIHPDDVEAEATADLLGGRADRGTRAHDRCRAPCCEGPDRPLDACGAATMPAVAAATTDAAELVGPARQIGRFGTEGQIAAAVGAVKDTTAQLYRMLADGVAESSADDAPTDAPD